MECRNPPKLLFVFPLSSLSVSPPPVTFFVHLLLPHSPFRGDGSGAAAQCVKSSFSRDNLTLILLLTWLPHVSVFN